MVLAQNRRFTCLIPGCQAEKEALYAKIRSLESAISGLEQLRVEDDSVHCQLEKDYKNLQAKVQEIRDIFAGFLDLDLDMSQPLFPVLQRILYLASYGREALAYDQKDKNKSGT